MSNHAVGDLPSSASIRAAVAGALAVIASAALPAGASEPAAILQDLRSFAQMGTVLHVAAHPDDENTQLITYLARGRGYRMAYLSVTRGDGGQNLLGPEFREQLGVARTQELLAARRLDGGQQFFTRAIDFGFSKDAAETLRIWDREALVGDVVRVIRTFRPDVIITRFSPIPGGTHGHHTSSAILALEAFKHAGDPKAFPEQLGPGGLTVWQPKRILQNGRGGDGALQIPADGDDPVLGMSFSEIAGRSRAMHKTQGFGNFTGRGRGGARTESFTLLDGEPATNDIMDGIDTTWARVAGGAEIGRMTDAAIAAFNADSPAASIPALLAIRSRVAALPTDPLIADKRAQLDRILRACLGLEVETTIASAEVVPGENVTLHVTATISATVPVRWLATRFPVTKGEARGGLDLQAGHKATRETTQTIPPDAPVTQPYWLRADGTVGMFTVGNAQLIGTPENAPEFPVEHVFAIDGQTLVVADEPVAITKNAAGEISRRGLDVIPPVSLSFPFDVELFAPGEKREVAVTITPHRAAAKGSVTLQSPAGWATTPARHEFAASKAGEKAQVTFVVTAPAQPTSAELTAHVSVDGRDYNNQRQVIAYDHIPFQLLQPPARLRAVALDLQTRGHKVGYLPGAGDSVAASIEKMGYVVSELTSADLTAEKLQPFDAVVLGVRAFNTRDDLQTQMPALFAWVEAGGTLIVQYNTPNRLQATTLAPYPMQLSGDRVTDENATVTLLAPDHHLMTTPNRITAADFEGWVQERGLYFPNQWDDHFTALLSCADPGEAPTSGSLLVARHGKGYYIYTGLAFFRQLPAGVPGAYRLFANLVSLGN